MKVVVYAICKNEAQFAKRWMQSMSEADEVVVLDTGSTDNSVEILRGAGAFVKTEIITPWRFDTARNRSLELVPEDADICVCTDLDEVFHPGWRKLLESVWSENTGKASYRYTWSFNSDGSEGIVFWIEKIHARRGYRWIHPVHEVLKYEGKNELQTKVAEDIQLDHFPDSAKSRGQYLPLLELSVKEDPNDDRNVHYLGREYMYKGRWDDCIKVLLHHLAMPAAVWRDERSASMRYIAKSYAMKGERRIARDWYLASITEAPHLREGYMDLSMLLYEEGIWEGVLYFTECALSITNRPKSYICEASSWGALPHDLRSIAFYHTGRFYEAFQEAQKALELQKDSKRLKENADILKKMLS